MSLESITNSMRHFLNESKRSDIDLNANWHKLKREFLELANKKKVFDINEDVSKLINRVKATNGYGEIVTDAHLNRVFPSLKFKYHVNKTPGEPTKAIKIKAPTYAPQKTGRIKSIDTPMLTFRPKINPPPKTSKFKTVKIDPDNREPMKPFPDELPPAKPKITDLIPTLRVDENTEKLIEEASTPRRRWINGFTLNNERDAITYVAAVDSKHDFLQFHFGTNNKEEPFQFQVENQLRGTKPNPFNTVTKRGVLNAENDGHSDFTALYQYVSNKTQFEMLAPIDLFSQFKVYKYFNYWKIKTVKKFFIKRLHNFADISWPSKPQYPSVIYDFRVHLLQLKQMKLFPYKTVNGELEFNTLRSFFADARDETYKLLSKVSGELRVILNNLSKDLNDHYNFIISPKAIDYLEMKKIPADLFMAAKMPFKHGQSLVEEKLMKIEHQKNIAIAKMDLDALPNFLLMCDKMVIQLFIEILNAQIKEFIKVFLDPNHEILMRTFLVYESETIMFNPSYRELTEMINDHIDSIFDLFRSFLRPCMIDPKGSGKFLDFRMLKIRLDHILRSDPNFSSCYNSLMEMIELAYKEAKETFNAYYDPAMAAFKFKENWEEMKRTETDPTIYINNLTELSKLQEFITAFKNTETHQFLVCDTKRIRTNLIDTLSSTIEENNTILFRNFEQICQNIISEINQITKTMKEPNDTLESQADYCMAVRKATASLPQIDKDAKTVNDIFERAQERAPLLVPMLATSRDEMKEVYDHFIIALNEAQRKLEEEREKIIASLVERQKALEERMNKLDSKTNNEIVNIEITILPDNAISDIKNLIQESDELSNDINHFESLATRLNHTDFDFSLATKTRNELEQNLSNWNSFKEFMDELTKYLETNVLEVDYLKLISFLNEHNENEMRSVNHPLFDKMADSYSKIYQYMDFFKLITKIELNEEHWTELAKIFETTYAELKVTMLKKFLDQKIISSIDKVKAYVLNVLQRADLSQSFDKMILDVKSLLLRLTNSPVTKTKVITFPSIHEAMNTCEHYVLYLHSLECSPFYSLIQEQVDFWMRRLKMSLNILNALSLFQTKYMYFCSATITSFCATHFPYEYHAFKYIFEFFKTFIEQIEFDNHVLSLIPSSEEQLKKEIAQDQSIPSEQIDRFINQMMMARSTRVHSKYNLSITDQISSISHPIVNKDLNMPISVSEIPIYQGDILVQCLDEARTRCEILLDGVSHLLDLNRQKFPRFYFCTDDQILSILLACCNIRFLTDDLKPIFPSLSRFHVSIIDTARAMGLVNSNGETFQFSRDFDYENLPIVDLLSRTETEMQLSVRSAILDALSSREYTEYNKWLIRYPIQALIIAESAHFTKTINDLVHKSLKKPDFQPQMNEINEFIKCAYDYVQENPNKMQQVSSLISLKLKHRDTLSELQDAEKVSMDSFDWKKHISHVVKADKGSDQIFVQIGSFQIPYRYEMISDPDICILTPQEEAAALAMASCVVQAEFSMTKQMNGNRNIVKAFADCCGFPVFDIPNECIRNVFAAASVLHAVIRIHHISQLPAIFPNFFGLIEAKLKIIKCENHFREFDNNNWGCLIHIDEEKIPSWLRQRLRPIYLNHDPPFSILMKLNQIRRDFVFTEDTPVDFAIKVLQQPKGLEIFHTSTYGSSLISTMRFSNVHDEDEMKVIKVFFNLPELLLSNKFITLEEPLEIEIPEFLESKINELAQVIEKFDIISSHSQSSDFPIRPFPIHIVLHSQDRLSTIITIFSAFKESIKNVRPQLCFLSNATNHEESRIEISMRSYRSVIFDIVPCTDSNLSYKYLVTMPYLTSKMILNIIMQHPDLKNHKNDILSCAETYITANRSRPASEFLNLMANKLNLIRYVFGSENSIQMAPLAESVFNESYNNATISHDDILKMPFHFDMNIVITGLISSGKRTFAKNYIDKYASPSDIVLYSSPFNINISTAILDNLRFIARGVYGPPDSKKLFLCIFDYQLAIPEVKDFVSGFMLHHGIYSKQEEAYVSIERMQLIITTTNVGQLYNLNIPFFLIENFDSLPIDFEQLTKCNIPILTPEVSSLIQTMTTDERRFALAQKMISILQQPFNPEKYSTDSDKFYVIFSLFYTYNQDDIERICEATNITMTQLKRIQNNNKNIANFMSDINLCSRIIELIDLGLSFILIHQDTKIFQFIKNTEFVVLNSHFRTQLFAAMVKVSQEKKRTTFLLNMKNLSTSEVLNIIDFFVFNPEKPENSLIFESADFQIFKHYMDPRGEDEDALSKLFNLVSFILICDDNVYERNIPDLFKVKMITLHDQECEDISPSQPESAPFVEELLQFVNIDSRVFDEMVTSMSMKLRGRFQDFIDEIQSIIDFFSSLTSMRFKVENQRNPAANESESELTNRIEQLEIKINDSLKSKADFEDEMKARTNELSILQAKLSVQTPKELSTSVAAICSFSLEEQIEQINQWLSNRDDEFFIFVDIFKDLFQFTAPSNFTESSPNSTFCKLVTSIKQYDMAENNALISQKISNLGLKGESQAAEILNKISINTDEEKIQAISPLPLINGMVAWLSVVVKYNGLQEKINEVSGSLTQIRNRNNSNEERLRDLQTDYEQISSILKYKQGTMDVPAWLTNAWNQNEENVKQLMAQLENTTKLLKKIIASSVNSEKLLSAYAAFSVAYMHGFCSLPLEKRKEFLKFAEMDHLFDPLSIVDRPIEVELFHPVLSFVDLLSPDTKSPTMQMFNCLPVFDQILFSNILPQSPHIFSNIIEDNKPLLMHPIQVFYDPNDVALQLLVSSYHEAKVAFTSSNVSRHLFNAITDGSPLIVHIDSVESGKYFFLTVLHFILQINSTNRIQFEEFNKPINNNFKMFCVTKISPDDFSEIINESLLQKDVVFADMSISDPHNTQWFEISAIFGANRQIQQIFIGLLESISAKSNGILLGIKGLYDLSHVAWSEYFDNPQKQISLRQSIETIISNNNDLNQFLSQFKSLTSTESDHPQALSKYSQYVKLCRILCDKIGSSNNFIRMPAYQVLSSILNYSKGEDKGPMTPITAINNFQEMLFDAINCVPCKQRLMFQAKFEDDYLKGIATNTHLLFDTSFPKLSERPLGPLMPQLIAHVCQHIPTIPRQFFTFTSPDTIPFPKNRPAIVVVDQLIPTDFYSRAISQHLPRKSIMLLTLGSFSNQGLSNPIAFYNIIKGCKESNALFLVTYDELMPSYTIPAIIHYSHLLKFSSYYIVINENLFKASSLPLIPNAIVVRVSKPYTMSGCSRLVSLFPSFRAESLKYELPFSYLLMLLSHRNDFIMKYHQLLPISMVTRDLWSSGQFINPIARQFWSTMLISLFNSLTPNPVSQKSYAAIIKYFFKDKTPTIPGFNRVDFENETILSSEFPPNPNEIGRVIEEDEEPYQRPVYGWKSYLHKDKEIEFIMGNLKPNNEEGNDATSNLDNQQANTTTNHNIITVIQNAEIVNARMNFSVNEISGTGSKFVDLTVIEKESIEEEEDFEKGKKYNHNDSSSKIAILDGDDLVGYVKANRPGNTEIWTMVGVKIILPYLDPAKFNDDSSVEEEEEEKKET